KFNLGRVIKTSATPIFREYRRIMDKPRMLILVNPTGDLSSSYQEGIKLKNYLDKKRGLISVDFKSTSIDTLYVKKNIRDYDIIHFAGHSEFDPQEPNESGWILCDGKLRIKDIYNLAESVIFPSLVFSHSCFSAKSISSYRDEQFRLFSLAGAFLFSGVRHYIGTLCRIEDNFAVSFACSFYDYLIAGNSLGEALRLSRLKMLKEYPTNKNFWFSYILYGEPGFNLFLKKDKTSISVFKERSERLIKKYSFRFLVLSGIFLLGVLFYNIFLNINPKSYYLYLQLKKVYRQGRNQEVILIANEIIRKDKSFLAVYTDLASTCLRMGMPQEALNTYFEAISLAERRKNFKILISSYIGIGWIYHSQGEFKEAFDFYQKALKLAEDIKDKFHTALVLRKLAVWHIDKKDYQKALELLTKSSEINRENQRNKDFLYNLACDYFDFGLVFINQDDYNTAREFYQKSKSIFEKLKLKRELSDYYFNLGEIYFYEKEYQKALKYYLEGLNIDRRQNNLFNLASDYNMLGELYLEMRNFSQAEECFFKAVNYAQKCANHLDLGYAFYNLAQLYKEKKQKQKAREYLRYAQEIFKEKQLPFYEKIREEIEELN
ncbi:MAG: tetratricopeptide repeat protein, partial [Candidatus Omnitrophica bacterium]|nr:tetratricopeptide repeat protein [Candidatus Omnitrophota bacterium]